MPETGRGATSEQRQEPQFPFTAIVGQTPMKRALLLNAINTKIGGVLIRGKKGTAKSTAVRSLAALLPEVMVLRGCPYSCPPDARQGLCQWCESGNEDNPAVSRQVRIVDLPVGATEDRLVGSLDIEQAIKTGTRSFEPGLIAATHRGILYVDEVNLLNDHLVDVLLDAAAMGRNYIEREGISISHAADFILIGTMNPEEGDLRPQLLDRFGLAVEVDSTFTAEERKEVVLRRIAYESDPYAFMDQWRNAEDQERERILKSQRLLPDVQVGDDILDLITGICAEYQVDGMRADIVMYKTAGTIAAYEGRTQVSAEDVHEAAQMALLHRQRRQPFQQPQLITEQLDNMIDEFQNQSRQRESSDQETSSPQDQDEGDSDPSDPDDQQPDPPDGPGGGDQWFEIGNPFPVRSLEVQPPDHRARRAVGRRAKTITGSSSGRYVGARPPQDKTADLALDATLRAAAPYQQRRRTQADTTVEPPNLAFLIEPWDVREKVREAKTGSLIIFVVDASGSMGAQRRMVAVKGAILSLLLDAYQRRDRIGLISFRGTTAELLLPPTSSVDLAQIHLRELPTGGRTPLARALYLALDVIEGERLKNREVLPLLVLLTDGRANVSLDAESRGAKSSDISTPRDSNLPIAEAKAVAGMVRELHIPSLVIDTEVDFLRLGLAKPIAEAMDARYMKLEELGAGSLANAVSLQLPALEAPDLTQEEIQTLLQRLSLAKD
ncbi:MAG: putative cobaltochelatase [Chloroflexi bacterium]|nr:putative cobaltochelatase [Chloroflexota bacterium]